MPRAHLRSPEALERLDREEEEYWHQKEIQENFCRKFIFQESLWPPDQFGRQAVYTNTNEEIKRVLWARFGRQRILVSRYFKNVQQGQVVYGR